MPRSHLIILSLLVFLVAAVVAAMEIGPVGERIDWPQVEATVSDAALGRGGEEEDDDWDVQARLSWTYEGKKFGWDEPKKVGTYETVQSAKAAMLEPRRSIWLDPANPKEALLEQTTQAHLTAQYLLVLVLLLLMAATAWRLWVARRWAKRASRWIPQPGAAPQLHTFETAAGQLVVVSQRDIGGVLAALAMPIFPGAFLAGSLHAFVIEEGWHAAGALLFVGVGLAISMLYVSLLFRADVLFFGDDQLRYERSRAYGSMETQFPKSAIRHIVAREVSQGSSPNAWTVVVKAKAVLEVYEEGDEEAAKWLTEALAGWAKVSADIESLD